MAMTTWGEGIIPQTTHHATQYIQSPACQMQGGGSEEGGVGAVWEPGIECLPFNRLQPTPHHLVVKWLMKWNRSQLADCKEKESVIVWLGQFAGLLVGWWRGSMRWADGSVQSFQGEGVQHKMQGFIKLTSCWEGPCQRGFWLWQRSTPCIGPRDNHWVQEGIKQAK